MVPAPSLCHRPDAELGPQRGPDPPGPSAARTNLLAWPLPRPPRWLLSVTRPTQGTLRQHHSLGRALLAASCWWSRWFGRCRTGMKQTPFVPSTALSDGPHSSRLQPPTLRSQGPAGSLGPSCHPLPGSGTHCLHGRA